MSYWKDRQSETLEEILKNADAFADELSNLYAKSSFYLNDKIQGIFDKYRSKYGLSVQEAKILLNQMDDSTSYDEMLKRLKVTKGEEREELLKRLESPAYRYRINRLQEVQSSVDNVMSNIYNQEKDVSTLSYIKTANDSYYKTMFNIQKDIGVEFDFSSLNPKHIDTILKSKWSGKNYSERIWNNTQALSKQIKEELLLGILVGKTEKEIAQTINEKFQSGSYNARRLIQTESAYMSTMMDIEAYKEADIDTMKFVAMHDLKTSKICQQHDDIYVKIKDAVVGSNVPPLHPNCRSFMIPVIDEELDRNMKRRVKDENGHYKIVDANETYEQWYERTQGKKLDKTGWFETDKQLNEEDLLANIEIDITESDIFKDIAQKNVERLKGLLNEYDSTLVSYKVTKGSYAEGGSAYMLNGKTAINVSPLTFRINKATDALNLGENQIYGTTFHEFAHSLSQSKEGMNKDFWKEIRKLQREYKKNKYSSTWAVDKISVYADTNIDEFFAEGFTQGKLSKTPSPYSKKIVEITDKYFKKDVLNGKINIEVDEFTPCLKRLRDSKIVDTMFKVGTPSTTQLKNWEFDWSVEESKGFKVSQLYAKGDKRIQGLIATKPRKDMLAIEIDIVESAPFNNPHNKSFKKKEYAGIGGHLFAEAVRQSYEEGFDGFVVFKAKSNLIKYYEKELGAILFNPKDRMMCIDERGAKILYEKYFKK